MARRGVSAVAEAVLRLDATRRAAQTALQVKQARRNALAKEIGQGKRTGGDTAALEAEATALRDEMAGLEKSVPELDAEIRRMPWKSCRTSWMPRSLTGLTKRPTSC